MSEQQEMKPPAVSSTQPLWLSQQHDVNDLSAFAPKIVVVGVGGAGGNAGMRSAYIRVVVSLLFDSL